MTIFVKIHTPGIEQGATDFVVNRVAFGAADQVIRRVSNLITSSKVEVGEAFHVSNHELTVNIRDSSELALGLPLQQAISENIRESTDDVKARYGEAYRGQCVVERTGRDVAVIAFNRAAYAAHGYGAQLVLFPGSAFEWIYTPVNPAMLECAEPADVTYEDIRDAVVTGVREINQQRGLFEAEDDTEVLVSVRHRIPEILHRTTLQQAQEIWQGRTLMTAQVKIAIGSHPEIIGTPTFHRA